MKFKKLLAAAQPIIFLCHFASSMVIAAEMSPLIKFDVCVFKNSNVTEEEFFDWATKQYPVKAAPLLKKHGIVKWTQVIMTFGSLFVSLSRHKIISIVHALPLA